MPFWMCLCHIWYYTQSRQPVNHGYSACVSRECLARGQRHGQQRNKPEPGIGGKVLQSGGNGGAFSERSRYSVVSWVGVCPPAAQTDETAILYLAFLGHLLSTSSASQLPENARPCRSLMTA